MALGVKQGAHQSLLVDWCCLRSGLPRADQGVGSRDWFAGLVRDFGCRVIGFSANFDLFNHSLFGSFCTYPLLLSLSLVLEGVKRRNSGSRQRVEEYFTEASKGNMRFEADGSY